jgi:hypothetical protein
MKTNNNGLDCLIQVQLYISGLTLLDKPDVQEAISTHQTKSNGSQTSGKEK